MYILAVLLALLLVRASEAETEENVDWNSQVHMDKAFEDYDGVNMVAATVPVIFAFGTYCYFVHFFAYRKARAENQRAQELLDEGKGYPVWFSRHIYLGACHHLVLFVNGYKYELRLPNRDEPPTAPCKATGIATWPGRAERSWIQGRTHRLDTLRALTTRAKIHFADPGLGV